MNSTRKTDAKEATMKVLATIELSGRSERGLLFWQSRPTCDDPDSGQVLCAIEGTNECENPALDCDEAGACETIQDAYGRGWNLRWVEGVRDTFCPICAAARIYTIGSHPITNDSARDGLGARTAFACDTCYAEAR